MTQNKKPRLDFVQLTALVSGNLIGSGVFLLPATLAAFGSISLLGWALTTCGAIVLALIFSELANKVPKAGGPYAFAKAAFGDHVGFFTAWGYWILGWISNTALLVGSVGALMTIFGEFEIQTILLIELSILTAVTMFNLFDIQTTGNGALILTAAKVIPLIVLPIVGIYFINFDNFVAFNVTDKPFFETLNVVAFITLWGFVGLETGTIPGDEVVNPRKTIPLATICGTLIAATIYVLGTVMIFGVIPHEQLVVSKAPYAEAASIIFGGTWGIPVAVLALISCIGALNGWTMIVGRMPEAAAKDGLFPEIFARTNRHNSPHYSIIISALLTAPLIVLTVDSNLINQFNFILDISVTFLLVIYLICILSLVKISIVTKELNNYKLLLIITGFLFLSWAMWSANINMVMLSFTLVLLGIPLWLFNLLKKRDFRF